MHKLKKAARVIQGIILWTHTNKAMIGVVFSAVVALVGAEAITEEPIMSEHVNELTSSAQQFIRGPRNT